MMGVESLSVNKFHIRIVQVIAHQWKTKVLHVDPDLVCPSCFQNQRNQAVSILLLDDPVMGDSALAIFIIDGPFNDRTGFPGQWGIDYAG